MVSKKKGVSKLFIFEWDRVKNYTIRRLPQNL